MTTLPTRWHNNSGWNRAVLSWRVVAIPEDEMLAPLVEQAIDLICPQGSPDRWEHAPAWQRALQFLNCAKEGLLPKGPLWDDACWHGKPTTAAFFLQAAWSAAFKEGLKVVCSLEGTLGSLLERAARVSPRAAAIAYREHISQLLGDYLEFGEPFNSSVFGRRVYRIT